MSYDSNYNDFADMNREFLGDGESKPRHRNTNVDRANAKPGLYVEVRRNDVEKAMRLLKKKMANEGILRDLKRKEYYEKPSERRRRRHAEAVSRWRKKERQLREEW